MARILLFGATGHAGRAIFKALCEQGHDVTAVVRDREKGARLLGADAAMTVAAATLPETLDGICNGYEIVVSALGKSVAPNDWSAPTFEQVDLQGNLNILAAAKAGGVRQFVYISAFAAEQFTHLTYFRVHHQFSEYLMASGLQYVILQPPAIMSSFLSLADMAQKGWLVTIGSGAARTNPISERDLALACANAINGPNAVVPVGGKHIYTRHEINTIIQQKIAPGKTVRRIPDWLLASALPFWKIINKNMYDKLAFFREVIGHDLLAPQTGDISLEEYFS